MKEYKTLIDEPALSKVTIKSELTFKTKQVAILFSLLKLFSSAWCENCLLLDK